MEALDNNHQVFLELLRAGLWGGHRAVQEFKSLKVQDSVDWGKVYQLAREQSVQGGVLQGIEAVQGLWLKAHGSSLVPKMLLLQWIGEVQVIEQRNKAMNAFVADLFGKLQEVGIDAVLVKGQGIAQCYEKPLWRACGDVDLLLSESNYERAKKLLCPLATDVETEYTHFKHQGMTIDGWVVELHGTLHSRLSKRVDRMIDEVQNNVFYGGNVRSWDNSGTQVFLPSPDNDVIFIFTHILHHFFFEGIGLRQICDWCRLLYTYRDALNHKLLESRLRKAELTTEWKAFAAFAVEYLGMPADAMPLYSANRSWRKKAAHIKAFVLEVGNFGHKQRRDYSGISYITRKFVSFWGRLSDMLRHFRIFPLDSIRFFSGVLRSGLHAAMRGE